MCDMLQTANLFFSSVNVAVMDSEPTHIGRDLVLSLTCNQKWKNKGILAIRRIFFLVDMITNTKISNCPNVFKIDVV